MRPRLAPDGEAPAEIAALLALQRSAGNAAVARAVHGCADRPGVQRTAVLAMVALQRSAGNAAVARAVHGRTDRLEVQRTSSTRTAASSTTGRCTRGQRYRRRGERVGANIMVDFTAGELVEARPTGSHSSRPSRASPTTSPGRDAQSGARPGQTPSLDNPDDDAGFTRAARRSTLRAPGRTRRAEPQPGVRRRLLDAEAAGRHSERRNAEVGRTRRGTRVATRHGAFSPPVAARMEDGPGACRGRGAVLRDDFEIAALVTAGPMEDTYLGSVEWGWQSDATGLVTLKPFVALASGAPPRPSCRPPRPGTPRPCTTRASGPDVLGETSPRSTCRSRPSRPASRLRST